MNPIRRFLLGSGRLPPTLRAAAEADGVLFLAEELRGHVTYRHYRAPGEWSSWRREWRSTAVVVSRHRLLVVTRSGREIDVPRPGPMPRGLRMEVAPDEVRWTYDAAAFHSDRSGEVEVLVRTPHATQLVAAIGAV